MSIKQQLKSFLNDKYKLTLSEEKTLITHSSNKVKFLGYEISVRRNQEFKKDSSGRKKRTLNGSVELTVPLKKIEKFMFDKGIVKQLKSNEFKSIHRKGWFYLPDFEILERYNAEIRGILNYYYLAVNYNKLGYFTYLMEYSCLSTLAGKYNSSISKIKKKYRSGKDWLIKYVTSKGANREKKIVKLKDGRRICNDTIVKHRFSVNTNATIRARLQAGICELCGSKDKSDFEVHYVPKVKGLDGTEIWQQIMKNKRRKTLVVCEDCHKAIHEA